MHRTPTDRISKTIICVAVAVISCLPGVAESVDARRDAPRSTEPLPVESPTMRGTNYRIGRQDLLEIRVFELEELSQTVRVAGDGFITLPLLGRVQAAGLTKSALERQIAEGLHGRYVLDPQVTVFIKEFESTKIAVSGAVNSPGRYPMLGPMTLLDMISQAGGLAENHGHEILIMRKLPDGSTRRIPVDLRHLVQADSASNITLLPADVVYVAEQERMRIFVSGAVNNPDMFEIAGDSPVTVMRAITLAGGMTPRAAEKAVQIIRTDATGQRETLTVNYRKVKRGKAEDPVLQPNDVVLVRQSFF